MSQLMSAQTPLGRLSGVVHDSTGAVVANATITVTNEGTSQSQNAKSSGVGAFVFPQLPAGSYTIKIDATGFKTAVYSQVKVDPGQEYSLTATVQVGQTAEVVEVVAGADLVNTTTAENNNTVSQKQILDLPLLDRDITNLIKLQPGIVGIATRTTTAINGGRPSWTSVTQDGINIQDNFIRQNALDFLPSRPTQDIVGEFTITTNNQGVDSSGGSSQVKMITPSGTNAFHGSVYEYNRNNLLASNDWMSNHYGTDKPALNQNQFGARVGGPILKNKLFFFGYYEGYRRRSDSVQTALVPANNNYINGEFNYIVPQGQPNAGTIQQINVLSLANGGAGATIDPTVQKMYLSQLRPASFANNFNAGDGGLNTAGYQFDQRVYNRRNQYGMKFDYELNSKHHFEFSHNHIFEHNDRPDIDLYNPQAFAYNEDTNDLWVGAWRWTVTPKLQNEFRAGGYVTYAPFDPNQTQPNYFLAESSTDVLNGLALSNPLQTFMKQGRYTDTWSYNDNASYVTGNHFFRFGFSLQQVKVNSYNAAGIIPTITTGLDYAPAGMALDGTGFPAAMSASDLSRANALLGFLTGSWYSASQTFEVKDKTSGFVANQMNDRRWSYNDWAVYGQDSFKLRQNLTITYGLKWEYMSPVQEDNGLALLVTGPGQTAKDMVLNPNAEINFVTGGLWKPRKNNFAPSIGFAWDPFKDGKTSVRGGYTLAYVNDSNIVAAQNATVGNMGLESTPAVYGFGNLTSENPLQYIETPEFKVPRTLADQINMSATAAAYIVDPQLKQPYVNEFSFGIQRELPKDFSVEVRYVGTMGKQLFRGVDFNQTNAGYNQAYLADFNRARTNGYLYQSACTAAGNTGCAFNPNYNSSIAGSQPLTVLPALGLAPYLNSSTVRTYLQQNAAADLANWATYNGFYGYFPDAPAFFLNNPNIYVSDVVLNGAASNYNGLQTEVKRRMKNGLYTQFNYTFSKALANATDGFNSNQNRFDPLLDNARPGLEKKIADFNVTHVINANVVYDLPLGRGKRFLGNTRYLRDVVGGWQTSSIFHWQTGAPISILSTRGTFNRSGRSGGQGAVSTLTEDQIKKLLGLREVDGTLYYIDPSVIGADGRAVGADNINNSAGFAGQVFFNPNAGSVGSLGRLAFVGPSQFTWDFSVKKQTRVTERINTEFSADFFNFPNHPNFYVGDQNINSTTFGQVQSMNTDPRIIQLSLRVSF